MKRTGPAGTALPAGAVLVVACVFALALALAGCGSSLQFSNCDWQTGNGCPAVPMPCTARGPLPDPTCTPGALNPDVTQDTIMQTICKSGWATSVRPPQSYTEPLKRQLMSAYGVGTDTSLFQLDHLVSLELGGAPGDVRNFWPEGIDSTPGAHDKDHLENYLNDQICSGKMTLADAQQKIATDWVSAWKAAGSP